MATLGHIAVGMAAARLGVDRDASRPRLGLAMVGLSLLALAPDLDVVAFALGIPYAHPWGHRGAVHSPVFALLVTGVVFGVGRVAWRWPWRLGPAIGAVLLSHGLLDALTDGGLGIALLWPFSDARLFAPWQPLQVAPIGLGMLSAWGMQVLLSEAILFSPLLIIAAWPRRARAPAVAPPAGTDGDDGSDDDPEAVAIPIDGTLDLHNFAPREIKGLIDAYLTECRALGILEVRIVHGKGIGNLRRTVQAALERSPEVATFELAGGEAGGWGATLVTLIAPEER